MLFFILKFSACLSVFMVFYKLVLEQANMHLFKRFYLLSVVVISIVIPFITFTEYVEPQIVAETFLNPIDETILVPLTEKSIKISIDYTPIIIWSLYGLGVLLFSLKFVFNLKQIILKIKNNPKQKKSNFTSVLLNDLIAPHTFFSYIFLNKTKFESNQIPQEVMLHEETHATQKHSLDILFIELFQIIFWFNPLVYFLKKDIKLNHEFLADQAVINHGTDTKNYQNLLLAFSSDAEKQSLAHAINYSLIKKRFTVMKTQTSKQAFWFKNLILLPILAILIYSFSDKVIIEKEINNGIENQNTVSENEIKIFIDLNRRIFINDELVNFSSLSEKLRELSKKSIRTKSVKPSILIDFEGHLTTEYLEKIKNKVKKTKLKISLIKARSMSIDENKLNKDDVDYMFGTQLTADSLYIKTKKGEVIIGVSLPKKEQKEENKIKHSGNESIAISLPENSGIVNSNDLQNFNNYIKDLIKSKQQKATKKQVDEFNRLAKKYNKQPENKRIVKVKDVERLEYLYGLMNKEQKAHAETFPNCPPPPVLVKEVPSLQQKATREQLTAYNKWTKNINTKIANKENIIVKKKEIIKMQRLYNLMSDKQRKSAKPFPKFPPPSPPAMDTIYTYNSLTKRTKFVPRNRKNNLQYLKALHNKMSDAQKSQVENPSNIGKFIEQLDNLTSEQKEKINEVFKKIDARARSKGRKFYSAEEYKELEALYSSMIR